MFPADFRKWLRAFFERACLVSWMLLMTANTVVIGLAAELLVFGSVLSLDHIILIDAHTTPLLLCGVFATFNSSIVARLRRFGVDNLNFEIHEHAFNTLVEPPESWSTLVLTLLDETALRSHELTMLVRLIDEAPGPVERQDRRAEAKAWLKENRAKLTDEDKEFVNQHLGYLH